MNNAPLYNSKFYKRIVGGAASSAAVVVPKILELFPRAKSVVDFGCGPGVWLNEFLRRGLEIKGYDFGEGVAKFLAIPADFYARTNMSAPIAAGRKYDIAISLEVAEHIEADKADIFIGSLCGASDIIVFSAAIPGQGGTCHINERWPEYWIEKFKARGYLCEDTLRPIFWDDARVEWWYRQNIMIFRRDKELSPSENFGGRPLVHPELLVGYRRQMEKLRAKLENINNGRGLLKRVFGGIVKRVKRT